MAQTLNNFLKSLQGIKTDVEGFAKKSGKNVKDIRQSVQQFVKNAEHDFRGMVDKDLPKLVQRLSSERKAVEKIVQEEIVRAKKFLNDQKKELSKLQKKVETVAKKNAKKATKKSAPKATKKVTKKTAATTTKKKATKKVSKKA